MKAKQIKERYNRELADKLTDEYISKIGDVDVFSKSNLREVVIYRTILYTILIKLGKLNYIHVEEFFKTRNCKRGRSSIYLAANKMETVYRDNEDIRDLYDSYFGDLRYFREKRKVRFSSDSIAVNRLSELINSIEEDTKVQEILELVELRVKSWNWKQPKDKTKVYVSSY